MEVIMNEIDIYSFRVIYTRTKRGIMVHDKFYFLGTLSEEITDVIMDEFPWISRETLIDGVKSIISRKPDEMEIPLDCGTLTITMKKQYSVSSNELEDDTYYFSCISSHVNDMFTESLLYTDIYAPNLKEFKRCLEDNLIRSARYAKLDVKTISDNLNKFDINSIPLRNENSDSREGLEKIYEDSLVVVEGKLMRRKLFEAYDS